MVLSLESTLTCKNLVQEVFWWGERIPAERVCVMSTDKEEVHKALRNQLEIVPPVSHNYIIQTISIGGQGARS